MRGKTASGVALVSLMVWIGQASGAGPRVAGRPNLEQVIPAVSFQNVALRDAVDFLREAGNVNLEVQWKALEQAGVGPETAVSLNLRQVTLRKALRLMLSEAAGGPGLAFYVDDNVIEITTRQIADGQMFTRIYPVQHLLIEPPEFYVPDFALGGEGGSGSRGSSYSGGGRSGGRGTGRDFSSGTSRSSNNYRNTGAGDSGSLFPAVPDTQREKGAKAQELIELIKATIEPDAWMDSGTGKASIRHWDGNLVVTAPRSIHERLGGPVD